MSNNSPRDTGEMSVEDENRRNSETDDMHNILDSFMQAREETLEELVGGFMYLTMEDVRRASNTTTVPPSSLSPDSVFTAEDAETASTAASVLNRVTAPGDSSVKGEGGGKGGVGKQTEEIEEEVLEDSTDSSRHACEDSLFRHRPASLTKFDNFLLPEEDAGSDGGKDSQDEGGEGEDWMPTSGYMASFAAGNAASEEAPSEEAPSEEAPSEEAPSEEAPSEEAPSEEAPSQYTGSSSGIEAAEITRQKSTEIISTPSPQHGSSQHSSAVIAHDAGQTLSRDTARGGDRTNNAAATSPPDCDVHSSVCEDELEAPAWGLNPGEAEEEEEVDAHQAPVKPRMSVIDISTVKVAPSASLADGEGNAVSGDPDFECSDEVVPFELEEGHDYDSVVYTPKFTQAEMNYLASFLPQNS